MERDNLWAPWRIGYITGTDKNTEGCFLCHHLNQPESEDENLVLWRSSLCVVVMNRYPYNSGHLMVTPYRHLEHLKDMTPEERLEMTDLSIDAVEILKSKPRIVVTDCICRKRTEVVEKGCGKPMEACFMFGSMGQYYLDRDMGRKVSLCPSIKGSC